MTASRFDSSKPFTPPHSQTLGSTVAHTLPATFCVEDAFERFAHRPGCLWLDSAEQTVSKTRPSLGRYSYLTSDPIDTLVASVGDSDPWPRLAKWCGKLARNRDDRLPPFQGGIAGLVGYEAGSFLESTGVAGQDDFPTPVISMGKYDWTIAVDHLSGQSWLMARCLDADTDPQGQHRLACDRIEQVLGWLERPPKRRQADSLSAPNDSDGELTSNFTGAEFRGAVADIVARIRRGDSFQVNLAQRLLCAASLESPELYRKLRVANPAPFAAFYRGDGFEVLSSSPEGFLHLQNGHVQTRPIKGTVSRSGDAEDDSRLAMELSESAKDRAENVMIVDLMRNDLSRVCQDDSVRVTQLCQLESYQYVQHLVSVVEGDLRVGEDAVSLLKACFPGGSVTGAPKIEAMRTIAQLEPHRRGPYCGSIGYIADSQTADFNILIRTITASGGQWQIPVGGGITARSEPESEEAETWAKAEGMLRAIRMRAKV